MEVIELSPMGRALTNIRRVSFYRCPEKDNATADGRCMFMKPNKWQKYPIANNPRYMRTSAKL